MAFLRNINVLHVFSNEPEGTQTQLIESDGKLFFAWVEDILEQTGWPKEKVNQVAKEGFNVIVSRRDLRGGVGGFEEYTSALGYRTIANVIDQEDCITGGTIEAIACSLWLLGTRITVLHDIPFTIEAARRVISAINEWEYSDKKWCLLLARPKRKSLLQKGSFHFGIVNTTYLEKGLLDTSVDFISKGSEYNLDDVFKTLTRSAKKHGWREQYFDLA